MSGVPLIPDPGVEAKPRKMKRPLGVTIIAILWSIGGVLGILMNSITIGADLEVLPFLWQPGLVEWVSFAVPVELVLSLLSFGLDLVQLATIYGLWTGKSWSYRLALALPLLHAVVALSFVGLYMSAPAELGINLSTQGGVLGGYLFWIVIVWTYLRREHVKEYLGVVKPEVKREPFVF